MSQKTKLTHYSNNSGLKNLDPDFMGTGTPSEENKRGIPSVKRTYFYRENTEPEELVTSGAKSKYTVELDPTHKLYDLNKDPDNIALQLRQDAASRQINPGIFTIDELLGKIKDAGYHGYHNSGSSMPNVVALFHKHPVVHEEILSGLGKSEDLEKGAAKRLWPFDPHQISTPEREAVQDWQDMERGSDRENIPRMVGPARQRGLHKLHKLTEVRRHPTTGEREFLLHRGMGGQEFLQSVKDGLVNHDAPSSWTPNVDVAESHAGHHGHNYISAWIPESKIHYLPKQIGSTSIHSPQKVQSSNYGWENEVIVSPNHNSQIHDEVVKKNDRTLEDLKRILETEDDAEYVDIPEHIVIQAATHRWRK